MPSNPTLVDCSVRLIIQDCIGRYLMMVRGNEFARTDGERHLMLPGGGVQASPQGIDAFLRRLRVNLRSSKGDIRFRYPVTLEYEILIRELATTREYLEQEPAEREFFEEFCNERGWLDPIEAQASRFNYLNGPLVFQAPSVRHLTEGELTLYLTYLCVVTLPDETLARLCEWDKSESFMGEFVTVDEIKAACSSIGSSIHPIYKYTLGIE